MIGKRAIVGGNGWRNRKRSFILELAPKVFYEERYQEKRVVFVARVSVPHQSGSYPGSEDCARSNADQKTLQR
ncbi:unnamed protein product [Schistosoma curassoni]|uniref:Uncharacterized protein n=1 Tax=Schistosoma curassoni TaxID=6186 RepID=A0A183JD66_9TREM|nr:unnamed protein product [Schistosoma curassoni]